MVLGEKSPDISLSPSIDIIADDDMVSALKGVKKGSGGSTTTAESDGSHSILKRSKALF